MVEGILVKSHRISGTGSIGELLEFASNKTSAITSFFWELKGQESYQLGNMEPITSKAN